MRVEQRQAFASELLHSEKLKKLSAADHGLATQLTMGVLRWRSGLDALISEASSLKLGRLDLEVLVALRLGVFQLQFLQRVPARAAIFESVELTKRAQKKSAAPFVNAVLRKVERLKLPSIADAGDAPALATAAAHPLWLIERWVARLGLETARAVCLYNQSVPIASIHLRDLSIEAELLKAGLSLAAGGLLTQARRVMAGDIASTSAYLEGRVGIQDEGSQLVAMLVGNGSRILDCCAAPGGKTALMAERNASAQVFAVDLHVHRAILLRRLAARHNVQVIAADARQLPFIAEFDRVLADVPCSGTGTLAHNPEIKWRLKPADLHDLAARQSAILRAALNRVAPLGRLVYSTCSLEPEENEAIVEQALAGYPQFRLIDCRAELERLREAGDLAESQNGPLLSGPYFRSLPGVHPCDGFFAAVLERFR